MNHLTVPMRTDNGRELRTATIQHYWKHQNPVYWRNCQQYGFTDQEILIGDLMAAGLTNRAIAERLQIGEGSVQGHVNRIYRKLDTEHLRRQAKRNVVVARLKIMGAIYKPPPMSFFEE